MKKLQPRRPPASPKLNELSEADAKLFSGGDQVVWAV